MQTLRLGTRPLDNGGGRGGAGRLQKQFGPQGGGGALGGPGSATGCKQVFGLYKGKMSRKENCMWNLTD